MNFQKCKNNRKAHYYLLKSNNFNYWQILVIDLHFQTETWVLVAECQAWLISDFSVTSSEASQTLVSKGEFKRLFSCFHWLFTKRIKTKVSVFNRFLKIYFFPFSFSKVVVVSATHTLDGCPTLVAEGCADETKKRCKTWPGSSHVDSEKVPSQVSILQCAENLKSDGALGEELPGWEEVNSLTWPYESL